MIRATFQDGTTLEISRDIANYSRVICEMLEDDESEIPTIPLEHVDKEVFKQAIEFLQEYQVNPCLLNGDDVKKWFLELHPWYKEYSTRIVFYKIIKVAHYLNMSELVTFVTNDLAYKVKSNDFNVELNAPLLSATPVTLTPEQEKDILIKNKHLLLKS